ncbi:polysaccharide biosynthesis tyrosine autokinase [Aggregicoccus sp. 17bor-14]|uniref:polysaccharide biosynthesis tyrosine autokinase n=1 Tax=Myxococcaceae TaxID=31 RepID=UPI00129CDD6B|nr:MULTISPECIES: polysaccharide biosynthesis tyrosine autokinase [Myxococcaceae]MBF5043459.1 polysaccharide biosynthesis tyrosine autokinase [Simulacricoccus sp. 17bor-14]MRI89217.1 polysaccharide biosynthesis tyrosine autokinase [Aggregicoccus sp. 17bor-14]
MRNLSSPRAPLPLSALKAPVRAEREVPGIQRDLQRCLNLVLDYRWSILAITLLAAALGTLYALVATPIYRANVMLQVEPDNQGLRGLEELLEERNPQVDTELKIISSRSLLSKVVSEQHLDVQVRPRYFPLVGAALARRVPQGTPAAPPVGALGHFAWGGERLRVAKLEVPEALLDEPLTLVAREGGVYQLLGPDGDLLVAGRVGAEAVAPNRLRVQVAELTARPGTRFRVVKRPLLSVVEDLQAALRLSEQGTKTGIVSMSLQGSDPAQLSRTLDVLSARYVEQNVERHSEEAAKTLSFLESQLPLVRRELGNAERSLNAHRTQQGSVDLGMEAKAVLDKSVELERSLSQASLERSELRQRFTVNHPQVIAAGRKLAQLEAERDEVNTELRRLPAAEMQTAQLTRDVKVANEVYLMLSNKAEEYRVLKSSTVGNVRILDPASVSRRPVEPRRGSVMLLSLLLGLACGLGAAVVRRLLNDGVSDPAAIESELGVPVYATVPMSGAQSHHTRQGTGLTAALAPVPLLARTRPRDLAVESLRSLRTSLQFALADAPNNVLAITGPSPGVGKSFVSVNLAAVLADLGKRILLVDGDLRAGWLHRYFGTERTRGLSEVISGTVELASAVRLAPEHGLHFLPTGILPPNPSELLMSDRFAALVQRFGDEYDLVVIDTPPVLAVSDGVIVGRHAGVNLVVLRAGRHPMREIALTLNRLEHAGVLVQGIVFNAVPRSTLRQAMSGVYQYAYPPAPHPAGGPG